MRTDVFWIKGSSGRIGIAPRPRGGDWLEDEAQAWRDAGVNTVVSLLTSEEVDDLDLTREPEACSAQGIEFRSMPIPDRSIPASRADLDALVADLRSILSSGGRIVIHCRQGIGRSALVAASVLVAAGEDPHAAWDEIAKARGRAVPDTEEQRAWIIDSPRVRPHHG